MYGIHFLQILYMLFKCIDLNSIHSTAEFLEFLISTCPGNSAYKMYVAGYGSGFLNRA